MTTILLQAVWDAPLKESLEKLLRVKNAPSAKGNEKRKSPSDNCLHFRPGSLHTSLAQRSIPLDAPPLSSSPSPSRPPFPVPTYPYPPPEALHVSSPSVPSLIPIRFGSLPTALHLPPPSGSVLSRTPPLPQSSSVTFPSPSSPSCHPPTSDLSLPAPIIPSLSRSGPSPLFSPPLIDLDPYPEETMPVAKTSHVSIPPVSVVPPIVTVFPVTVSPTSVETLSQTPTMDPFLHPFAPPPIVVGFPADPLTGDPITTSVPSLPILILIPQPSVTLNPFIDPVSALLPLFFTSPLFYLFLLTLTLWPPPRILSSTQGISAPHL
ncbi:hypothetical protein AMTRI_Chr02g264820 [Amborella trichopoda]